MSGDGMTATLSVLAERLYHAYAAQRPETYIPWERLIADRKAQWTRAMSEVFTRWTMPDEFWEEMSTDLQMEACDWPSPLLMLRPDSGRTVPGTEHWGVDP